MYPKEISNTVVAHSYWKEEYYKQSVKYIKNESSGLQKQIHNNLLS